jgi:hypothetical protein
VIDQSSVSFDGAREVNVSWNVLPNANRRAPSAEGVSALTRSLPLTALVFEAIEHVIVVVGVTVAFDAGTAGAELVIDVLVVGASLTGLVPFVGSLLLAPLALFGAVPLGASGAPGATGAVVPLLAEPLSSIVEDDVLPLPLSPTWLPSPQPESARTSSDASSDDSERLEKVFIIGIVRHAACRAGAPRARTAIKTDRDQTYDACGATPRAIHRPSSAETTYTRSLMDTIAQGKPHRRILRAKRGASAEPAGSQAIPNYNGSKPPRS